MLAGRVAVVTGAGSGMGRATARLMAEEGAAVGVADIELSRAETVATEINQAGGRAIPISVDTRDVESNRAMVSSVVDAFGALHVAHLHTGGGGDSTVLDADVDGFDKGIALTLRGTFLGLTATAPAIVDAAGGSIVCTSSVAAILGQRGLCAYSAGKAGVLGLVRSAAAELAPHNVRVNAICPNVIHTGIFSWKYPRPEDLDAEVGRFHTLNRVGRPEEVANLVVFLASDKASFMTGGSYLIDGGSTSTQSWEFHEQLESMFSGSGRGMAQVKR